MGSVILRSRLEMLSSNLQDVERVMEFAQRRAKDIDALKTLLFERDGIRGLAGRLKNRVERSLRDIKDQEYDQAVAALQDANTFVQQLTDRLDSIESAMFAILRPPVELSTRRIQERLSTVEPNRKIADVRKVLESSGPLTTAWAMEKTLSTESEPLFAEYVDLLRGLALRETGIERGICDLADRLLDGCDRPGVWKSLAIPSYRGPTEKTPAQIIHLGFPEWTIWALPLAAHEFGRILVQENETLLRKVSEEVTTVQETQPALVDALGDAFATYAVGPAYACAAVLMRLDPRPTQPDGPAIDDMRAQTIFAMLKEADERAGPGVSFANVHEPLEQMWAEAVAETGAAPAAASGPKELATFFWRWADFSYRTAKYQPMSWLKAQKLQEALARRVNSQPPAADDDATIGAGAGDVRDMLNAAWLFRLKAPDRSDEIAQKALEVWQDALSKPHDEKTARFASLGSVQPGGRTS